MRGQGGRGPALADHRPHAHRAGLAAQAGHRGRARLAARRGGGPAHQAGLRLDPRRAVLRARRGARSTSARPSSAATSSRPSGRSARGLQGRLPGAGRGARAAGRGTLPDGWDDDVPRFHADEGMIATRKAGNEVLQWAAAQVPELVGGSADLAPSTLPAIEGAGRRAARRLRRPQPALRHPRARHGRDRQRPGPPRLARLRLDLPDLQRLHEGRRSGSRRSWASRRSSSSPTTRSASARTARRTSRSSSSRSCARMPNIERRAPGGRERDRAGVALRPRAARDADRASRSRARACRCGTRPACPTTRSSAAPTCCARATRSPTARPDPHRDGLGGAPLQPRGRPARGRRASPRASSRMPCMERFAEQDAAYRDTVLPPDGPRARVGRGRCARWAGTAGPATTAR